VALGLVAAIAAPRAAHANVLFTENSAYSLGTTQTACSDTGDPGCWTNSLQFVDIDGDGDFDVLKANGGGVFTTGNSEESLVFINDGKGAFLDANSTVFSAAHSQSRQFAAGDIDGDGDIDIYMPGGYGADLDRLWVQTSKGVYADQASTLLPAALKSNAAAVKFGDLDGDGDLDLVVADWGTGSADSTSKLILYLNDSHGVFTAVETQGAAAGTYFPATLPATATAPYYGARPTDIDFADIDGDFDLDILINHREGYSRIFLNDGHAKFTDGTAFVPTFAVDGVTVTSVTANYPPKKGTYAMAQDLCDLDEDGDLDLVVDDAALKAASAPTSGGTNSTQVLFNNGSGVFSDVTAAKIVGEPGSLDGTVKCADVDGDGHYDLVVGSRTNTSEKVLVNNGSGVFTYVAEAMPKFTDITLGMDVGDLNADGKLDILTGQGEGTSAQRLSRVYLNIAPVDSTPPVFRKIETPVAVVGTPTVFRMAVRDSATNDVGQMVKSVSVSYSVNGAAAKVAKAVFVGGDLFRVSIPAQVDGASVTLTPTAVDRYNLTKLSTPIVLQFGTPTGNGGASGGGAGGGAGAGVSGGPSGGAAGEVSSEAGAAGLADVGDAGTGGTEAGGTTGSAGKGGASSAGKASTAGGEAGSSESEGGAGGKASSSSGDDGCSCSMVPSTQSRSAVLLAFGMAALGLARRRRNQK
jgi:MYXO-CTERM domain-containing protein